MIRGYILISLAMASSALPAVGAPVDSSELARCHAMPTHDQQLDCYEALAAASGASTAVVAPTAPAQAATVASGPAVPTASVPGTPGPAAPTASRPGTPAAPAVASAPGSAAPTASRPGTPAAPAVASAPGSAAPTAPVPGTPGSAAPAVPSTPGVVAGAGAPPPAPFDPDDPANFGLSRRPTDPHQGAPISPTSVKSTVFQMTEDRLRNVTVLLDNGQTWKFIEPDPRLRPGDAVTIKRASLGSFLMLTPSRRSYRVERTK